MPLNISSQSGFTASKVLPDFEKHSWALNALSQATAALARAQSQDILVQEVCSAIAAQGPYVLAWVGRAEDDVNKSVKVIGGAGSALAYIDNIVVSWSDQNATGMGPAGISIRTNQPSIVSDSETDPGFASWKDLAGSFGIRSAIGCPIQYGERPFGALLVYSKLPNAFGPNEVLLFKSLANEIGFGLRLIDRQRKLDDQTHEKEVIQERLSTALFSTIEAMSKTMEWRDPYTAGHQKRVALISEAIARNLGWKLESIQALYMASMVHDLGKVAVPSEILTKPTKLTDVEMKLVEGHVEAGYQILKNIPFPWPIAEIVHQHHERLDGSGYPRGLKGDEICKEARVLAVADTIEAIASHRPYRPARGLNNAIEVIRAEAGLKLDPKVVDAALDLIKQGNVLQAIIEST